MLDMEAAELRGQGDAFVRAFISGQSKILNYANLDWWRNVLHPDQWADDVYLWTACTTVIPAIPAGAIHASHRISTQLGNRPPVSPGMGGLEHGVAL